jgi:hypothetical protein
MIGCLERKRAKDDPRTALMIAVFAPIPMATVRIAMAANNGFRMTCRSAKRMS